MTKDPEKEQEIARAILQYLQVHPDAKDTLDGIAQWWLLKEWTARKIKDVKSGVSVLLSKGLIIERKREGLPPYYWLNRAKENEIRQILNSSDSNSLEH